MPKAILEFDLSDPDDVIAHRRAIKAQDAYFVLAEMNEWLRLLVKHSDPKDHPPLDEVRTKLHAFLLERGVDLEDR